MSGAGRGSGRGSGDGSGQRRLRGWRPSPLTWGLVAVAAGSAAWAHLDARRGDGVRATLVSTRSSAWRVLPELSTISATGATVELWPSHGAPVRLVPMASGHAVWAGDTVLGPADPEAMEGVWDSLRLATTVRAADEDSDAALGSGGRIVVALPDGGVRTIVLGQPTADGAGHYGAVEGGAEGTEGLWVLEQELSILVQQAPEAWLARRLAVIEATAIQAVRERELRVERGIDGHWRARLPGEGGEGPQALLDRVAVETRIDRLVSARLDPLVEPGPGDEGEPWLTLEGQDGVDVPLRRHGACPGRPDRVLVDRGPGRWGCIDAALVAPWPVPGRDVDEPGALLDPRLVPHEYGRVLRIELQGADGGRVLSRYGGGWRIEEPAPGGRTAVFDVDEPEVFRWYQALHEAEVSLAPAGDDAWPDQADVELRLTTDSTATLRLRCVGEGAAGGPKRGPTTSAGIRCRRDDGPVLWVRDAGLPPLAFDVDAFAQRRLTEVRSEEARALEILPGPAGSEVVRQSVHFDLGVWRLDAPAHPEGDAALDSLRLEALLAALSGLRAEAWVDGMDDVAAVRRLRLEQVPRRGQDPVIEVELLPECVARIEGQRPARLSEGTCETLRQDLLVEQPLVRPVDTARGLELSQGGRTARLQRKGAAWVDEQGGPARESNAWLRRMVEREASELVSGEPPGPTEWTLRVLPSRGTAFAFEGGEGWLRVQGEGWWYRLAETDPDEEDSDDDHALDASPDEPDPDPTTE